MLLYRTRWPNLLAITAAILLTVDLGEARLWMYGYLGLVILVNLITYPQMRRLEQPPTLLGLVDILAPMALPVFVPALLFPALVLSMMTAAFARLVHSRNLTLLGIALTTLAAAGLVSLRSIPIGAVMVTVYAISAYRTTIGLGIVMSDEVRVAAVMRSLAATDPLTGMPNRSSFAETFSAALDEARHTQTRLAVLTIDLNGFKEINDIFGHDAGDQFLQEVAGRIEESASGAFVARQGGDEFSVLIEDATSGSPHHVAEAIHHALDRPIELEHIRLRCDASIGIAYFPDHGSTTSELTTSADLAMYEAKRGHRRTLTYRAETGRITHQSTRLVGELEAALESGEITVEYDPVRRLTDGQVLGADARVVWDHPSDGRLLTRDLRALLGLTHFRQLLWRWTLAAVCAEAARWNDGAGSPWIVGSDILAANLEDRRNPDEIGAALEDSGLEPNLLSIQIPELLVQQDERRSRRFVDELHDLGVRPTISRFGSAHTSLLALARMRIATVRLDPSLTLALPDPRTESAIRSMCALADDLDVELVATGIDSAADAEHVLALGITVGQGTRTDDSEPRRSGRGLTSSGRQR